MMWIAQIEVTDSNLSDLPELMKDITDILIHGGEVRKNVNTEYSTIVFSTETDNVGLFSIMEQIKKRKYVVALRVFNVLEKEKEND